MTWILFQESDPIAAYSSEYEAKCAIWKLPSSLDDSICLVAVPLDPKLVHQDETIFAAPPGGGRRVSGGPARGAVTLSLNGNKIT